MDRKIEWKMLRNKPLQYHQDQSCQIFRIFRKNSGFYKFFRISSGFRIFSGFQFFSGFSGFFPDCLRVSTDLRFFQILNTFYLYILIIFQLLINNFKQIIANSIKVQYFLLLVHLKHQRLSFSSTARQ